MQAKADNKEVNSVGRTWVGFFVLGCNRAGFGRH
jgi:hypothetical protein